MEQETHKEEEQKENANQINIDNKPEEQKVEKEEENKKEEEEENKKEEEKEEEKKEEKDDQEKNKEDEKEEKKEEDLKEENKKEEKKEKSKKKPKKEKKGKEKHKNLILTIDEENNKCVDCGKENPTKVSINNGVIICEDCAAKHEELGHAISFVKDIDDDFDEYLLNFIVFGSNSKFKRFLTTEQVDPTFPIEKKYLTKACFFYRNNLKRKVQGQNLQENKDYENPNELIEIENVENNYPEFEHYKMKSKVVHDGVLKKKQDNKLNKLGGSILSFGKKMYGGIKTGANYVAKKAEPTTKTITKGAKIGAGFVGKQVGHAYDIIKKNVKKGKKTEDAKEEGEMDKNNHPPNDEKNENNVGESGRPLQAGDEVKEEKVEAQKEEEKHEQPQEDPNEEKIDI